MKRKRCWLAAAGALLITSAGAYAGPHRASATKGSPFEGQEVLRMRIEIDEAGLESLREDHRKYVAATVTDGGEVHTGVGVRLKGSAGSFQAIEGPKPGFTLKADWRSPKARIRGMRKLLLNNAVQDPSYFSELIGNELFRAAGIPAARAGFASVELNGKDLGLYVLMEGVTRDFLSRNFENPYGSLFEGPGDVNGELDVDARGPFSDREELQMLVNAASERDPAERMRRLAEVLDVDRFITFLVMEAELWHWDGYAIGVNNFRVYADPAIGKLVFLPHGSDQLFQDPEGPVVPGMQGFLARAVLETREGRRLYSQRAAAVVKDVLVAPRISKRIEELAARVRPVLEARGGSEARDHEGAVESLIERIERRVKSLDAQLADGGALFGEPVEFDRDGVARLASWSPRRDMGRAEVVDLEGVRALWIAPAEEGGAKASFRTRILLEPGNYVFKGRLRTRGVEVEEREEGDAGDVPGGACLRVSHHQPARKVVGDKDWAAFAYSFRVIEGSEDADAVAAGTVQLVCELRAARGEAWFDLESLHLTRAP